MDSFKHFSALQRRHIKERLKPVRWQRGPRKGMLKTPGREMVFDLAEYRAWLISQRVDGREVYPCAYCKRRLTIDQVEPDHDVPLSRNGGIGLDNLCTACALCNRTKGELTGEEYLALIDGLKTFDPLAERYILRKLRERPAFRPPPTTAQTDAIREEQSNCDEWHNRNMEAIRGKV